VKIKCFDANKIILEHESVNEIQNKKYLFGMYFRSAGRLLLEAFVSSLTDRLHRQTSKATAVTMTTRTALFCGTTVHDNRDSGTLTPAPCPHYNTTR
jgi:hypothetical protein